MFKIVNRSTGQELIDTGTGRPMYRPFKEEGVAGRIAANMSCMLGEWLDVVEVPDNGTKDYRLRA